MMNLSHNKSEWQISHHMAQVQTNSYTSAEEKSTQRKCLGSSILCTQPNAFLFSNNTNIAMTNKIIQFWNAWILEQATSISNNFNETLQFYK